jgi:hypothetical protein
MFEMSKVSVVNKKMQWSVLFVMTLTCSEFDLLFVEKYGHRRTRRPWMHEGQYCVHEKHVVIGLFSVYLSQA